ncbi:MAG: glycosyltransferase [Clostridia bacterium]|nr:glycosyltransferase [Clostridia bacterium]
MEKNNCLARLIWRENDPLCVRADEGVLSCDTYFNSLACDPWTRFTDVRRVAAKVEMTGHAVLSVCHYSAEGEKVLSEKEGAGKVEIPFELPATGLVYLKVRATEETTFCGGGFYALEEPKNDVSVAVAICTYRREEYVRRNVRAIEEYKAFSGEDLIVYVVDNGGTLTEGDVPGANLIKNPNLGGSGGFCRGMVEAYKAGRFTHVLLMDDDVSFESESLGRICSFLRYVKKPDKVGVGASMITEDRPTLQFELGATWDGDRLRGMGKEVDLTDVKTLFDNATRTGADYTAWWCCCMPLSVVDKVGMPMPMFIKNDDVEYGVRSGLTWAFPSGVGVWHTAFESKYSPFLEYYIKRNELISNCLNRKRGLACQFMKLVRSGSLQLVQQRYFVIPYMIKGYEDFLKGPEYLAKLDAAQKNKELIASQPKQLTKEELKEKGYDVTKPTHGKKRNKLWQIVTLNGQLLPTFTYQKAERRRVLDCNNCPPRDFFGATETAQFNYYSGKGFVTKQKRTELIKWAFAFIEIGFKMLLRYYKVRREYQKKAPILTSLEYWEEKWRNNNGKN